MVKRVRVWTVAAVLGAMGCGGAPSSTEPTPPSAATAATFTGAACQVGGTVYMGCDGQLHANSIVRWTQPDGDVVTCWENQNNLGPSCATGTPCVVFVGGAQSAGTCL